MWHSQCLNGCQSWKSFILFFLINKKEEWGVPLLFPMTPEGSKTLLNFMLADDFVVFYLKKSSAKVYW